jgi:hypothetical protein
MFTAAAQHWGAAHAPTIIRSLVRSTALILATAALLTAGAGIDRGVPRKSLAVCAVLQAWWADTNGHTDQLFVSRGCPSRNDAAGLASKPKPDYPESSRSGVYAATRARFSVSSWPVARRVSRCFEGQGVRAALGPCQR